MDLDKLSKIYLAEQISMPTVNYLIAIFNFNGFSGKRNI